MSSKRSPATASLLTCLIRQAYSYCAPLNKREGPWSMTNGMQDLAGQGLGAGSGGVGSCSRDGDWL
jgi:hypothetical protein